MKIVRSMQNSKGETYWLKINCDKPAELLRGLWERLTPYMRGHEDAYFVGELTDRGRCVRTTVSRSFERDWDVLIRTHGFSPSGDTQQLHSDVLDYMATIGIDLRTA